MTRDLEAQDDLGKCLVLALAGFGLRDQLPRWKAGTMKKAYVTRDTRGYIVPTVVVPDGGFVLEEWDDFTDDIDTVTETIVYSYKAGAPSDPGFRSWPERGFTGQYRGPLKTDSRGEKYREQTWKKVDSDGGL